ncbi:hypothetical protein [Flagellimonas crocea]|uniref:hypothetical protein n=1 Tax=Flagellimonas crocea TaxID=3067311 RepID=UPI0029700733|nr:hypothetical protein [Muricauda sp. DH64]
MKGKYFIGTIIAVFLVIVVLITYKLLDYYPREEIYVHIEDTDSFPIIINLYNNEHIEMSPIENPERYSYGSNSTNKTITLDSLTEFFRHMAPPQIIEHDVYVVQQNLNGKKRVIPVKLAYVLVD